MSHLPGVWHATRAAHRIAAALRRRSPRGLVLLYHRVAGPRRDPQWLDVAPDRFDAHMATLARVAHPLALHEFEVRRRAGDLPARAVAVTFDDGYADNLHAAAPALARHGVCATVFVTAGMVGGDREFWWDDAERIAFAPGPLGAAVPGLDATFAWSAADGASDPGPAALDRWTLQRPNDPTARHRLYRALCAVLHPLQAAARDARLDEWRAWAAVAAPPRASHRTLGIDELRALATSSGITVGAHTMTHPSLALLEPAAQRRELSESRTWLERALGRPVRSVAYPFGTRADVSRTTTRAARAAGFDFAMANEPGTAWRGSSRWRVPRALVRDWDAETFERQLDRWLAD